MEFKEINEITGIELHALKEKWESEAVKGFVNFYAKESFKVRQFAEPYETAKQYLKERNKSKV